MQDLGDKQRKKYNNFLIAVIIFLVIVFFAMFYYLYNLSYQEQVNSYLEEQNLYVSIVQENLSRRIKNIIEDPYKRFKELDEFDETDSCFYAQSEIKYIALLEEAGEISKVINRFDNNNTTQLSAELEKLSRKYWDSVEEDYYVPPLLISKQRQLMVVFYPLQRNDSKEVIAVVSDLSNLTDKYIAPIELKEHGTAYMINGQGEIVYDRAEEIIGKNVFQIHQGYEKLLAVDKKMINQTSGSDNYKFLVRETGEMHKKYISWSTIQVGTQQLVVAMSTPETSITSQFEYFRNRFLIWSSLIILLLIVVGTLFFRINNQILVKTVNRLKAKYRRQTEKLKLMSEMVEQADDSIIQTDTEGYIEYVNKSAEELFGWSREELYGRKPDIFNAEDNEAEVQREIYQALEEGKSYQRVLLNKRKDGSTFWCQLKVIAITDKTGEPYAYMSMERDVSERVHREQQLKQAKRAAEAANRAKSEFLANMSHEIRTPLNAVIGFSELLEEMVESSEEQKHLDAIKKAGNNLLALLNDILDLSKIEAGELKIEYDYFDLRQLLEEMEQIFSQEVKQKGLSFMIDIKEELPLVNLDEQRMRQIMLNLISNAVKFTDQGYIKVVVDIEKDNTSLKLSLEVTDTGIGIPQDKQDDIFSSFRQQDNSISRQYEGTGLGLAITERLTEMMGGSINLESQVGQGSTFRVEFEKVKWKRKEELGERGRLEVQDFVFESARILAVDDIQSNRELLKAILEKQSLKVTTAVNGRSAIELAQQEEFDLILLDLKMPDIDGYQVLEEIKDGQLNQDTPVLALTASATKDEIEKIRRTSFDNFITKPLQKDSFLKLLTNYLDYELKEIKAEKEKITDITKEEIELDESKLENLITELEDEVMVDYQELEQTFIINEVEEFADRIEQIALDYELEFLVDYAGQLREYTSSFELDKARKHLNKFKVLFDKLNSLT
ncbi:MAG: ATP-binding protein [Halanaerobacter sp.]